MICGVDVDRVPVKEGAGKYENKNVNSPQWMSTHTGEKKKTIF